MPTSAAPICRIHRIIAFFIPGESPPSPHLTDIVKLAQECCYHSNLAVAAHGITVLANIAISCPEKGSALTREAEVGVVKCGYFSEVVRLTFVAELLCNLYLSFYILFLLKIHA